MQDKLLRQIVRYSIKALKKGILRAIYFGHFLSKTYKNLQPRKQLPVIMAVLFFIFFSYAQIINQSSNIIFSKNTNKELRLDAISSEQKTKIEEKNYDFQIATLLREKIPSSEIALTLNNTALVATNNEINQNIIPTRTEIEIYIVKPNDNPWDIAEKFGLNVWTVLWANNLTYWRTNIQPGDELTILPLDGILHKIKKGEKLSQIAKKYKVDSEEIITFNNLINPDSLSVGETLIIPDGSPLPAPKPIVKSITTNKSLFVATEKSNCSYTDWRYRRCSAGCHRYYWKPGQCTDWVAYKWATELGQCVGPSNWGNARTWFNNAKRDGYKRGYTLNKGDEGSIVVLKCNNWYGHVAYIESFDDNYVYFSEMNGPSNPSWTQKPITRRLKRTLQWQNTSQGRWQIVGYIYPKH